MSAAFEQLVYRAADEVRRIVTALPAALREKAQALPVTYEPVPNPGLQEDGIAPDTLGLFTGPDYGDEELTPVPLPPQIILCNAGNVLTVNQDVPIVDIVKAQQKFGQRGFTGTGVADQTNFFTGFDFQVKP